MKCPSCSSAITKAWVQYVVEEHLKKQQHSSTSTPAVNIKEFTTSRGAKAGDAFNSELVTLDISASLTEQSEAETPPATDVEYHFIAKFLSTEPVSREVNSRVGSNLKEYVIYASIIKDLNAIQSSKTNDEFRIDTPELIYGKCSGKEFVLVMENIKVPGYDNNNKYEGLGYHFLKEAVDQLARVHALSYIYNKTHNFLEKYPYFQIDERALLMFASMSHVFIDNGVALLKTKEDMQKLATKIQASKERLITEFFSQIKENPYAPYCMCHGDYWNNNIMYKREEEGHPEGNEGKLHCKIVDWGNSGWGSPVVDLQYLIYTSTTMETRKEHLESILQGYHSTFTDITTKLDTPVPNWSYDDFQKEWRRLSVYGFFMGMGLSQGTLSKSNPINKPKEASLLDRSGCLPAKLVVDGMKSTMAKLFVSFTMTPSGAKIMKTLSKKLFLPIREELLSGSNEVMNKRLLDLMCEGDDRGLFDE